MRSKIDYKTKFYLLVVACIVASIGFWRFPVKRTLDLSKRCNAMEVRLLHAAENSRLLIEKELELKALDMLIGNDEKSPDFVQQYLLSHVEKNLSQSAEIQEVMPIVSSKEEAFEFGLHRILVEGDFGSLLSLSHSLEFNFPHARILAVHYHTRVDRKTRKRILTGTFFLRSVSRLKPDNP